MTGVDELHRHARRDDRLRERGQVELGIVASFCRFLVEGDPAERLAEKQTLAQPHLCRRRWKHPGIDRSSNHIERGVNGHRRSRATVLTSIPTPTHIAVPTTTYHVHASGVNALTASIAASDMPMPAITPVCVADRVSTPMRNAPSIGP